MDKIKSILLDNGYPEHIINSFMSMTKKKKQFFALPKFGPEKCPVSLRLPWLGPVSKRFEKQVTSAVKHCYPAVKPRVIYNTIEDSSCCQKGCKLLPASHNSNVHLSIFMPLRQSVCGPYLPKTAGQNQTARSEIHPLWHFSKTRFSNS